MTAKTTLELQCLEAQACFVDFMLDRPCFDGQAETVLEQFVFSTTPIESWDVTLPYMLTWAFEEWGDLQVTLQ